MPQNLENLEISFFRHSMGLPYLLNIDPFPTTPTGICAVHGVSGLAGSQSLPIHPVLGDGRVQLA